MMNTENEVLLHQDAPSRQMVMFSPRGESTDLALMVDALAHGETHPWHAEITATPL